MLERVAACPHEPRNLYEINTRLWLRELSAASLREVPDQALDELQALGFDLVWLMGVWAPSEAACAQARAHQGLRREIAAALPDFSEADIVASPYAVAGHTVSPRLGTAADLAHLRQRLRARGMGLILDFVPNHTATDHPFVTAHPEYYVGGPAVDRAAGLCVPGPGGRLLYHGRDPHFPPWTDTAQLDIRRRDTRRALIGELRRVAGLCDGVRCDMAMLLLEEVFARTWAGAHVDAPPPEERAAGEFWAEAIDAARAERPGLLFIAEAYWGTERRLTHLGFDACYDKTLYDRLLAGDARGVRAHLQAGQGRQRRLVRFLENHDEPRIAALLPPLRHETAALLTLLLPGLRLLHHGQLDGARRRVPVQLARRPEEPADPELAAFYRQLLHCLRDPVLRQGRFKALSPGEAWPGNPSHDGFVLYGFDGSLLPPPARGHRLLLANLAGHRAQCRVPLALPGLAGRTVRLSEVLSSGPTPPGDGVTADGRPLYLRDGDEMARDGLFLELPAHTAQLLEIGPT